MDLIQAVEAEAEVVRGLVDLNHQVPRNQAAVGAQQVVREHRQISGGV